MVPPALLGGPAQSHEGRSSFKYLDKILSVDF